MEDLSYIVGCMDFCSIKISVCFCFNVQCFYLMHMMITQIIAYICVSASILFLLCMFIFHLHAYFKCYEIFNISMGIVLECCGWLMSPPIVQIE